MEIEKIECESREKFEVRSAKCKVQNSKVESEYYKVGVEVQRKWPTW
jgi:hypothetical protein